MATIRTLRSAVTTAILAAGLAAHGGIYRGPTPTVTPPGSVPGMPGTPGGSNGPKTGVRGGGGGATSWETWWSFNKEPFLRLKESLQFRGVTSGSDDFYLGLGRNVAKDTQRIRDEDRRERLVPALLAALESTRNRDMTTACLIALGKIGPVQGHELVPVFAEHLARKDQEIRETAALALGIFGDPAGFEILVALAADGHEGRRLSGKGLVDDRTRAFAIHGLGLLGRRSGDLELKERVFGAIAPFLADRRLDDRDMLVAAVSALGILDPMADGEARGRRLIWQCTEALWAFYERDLGKADQVTQAHVPIAVARLIGRGDGNEHRRAKATLLAELKRDGRHNSIHQSAIVALGMLGLPREECPEDAACSDALLDFYRNGVNRAAAYFALTSMGRIGGAWNRSELLKLHGDANKATARPWASLGLALIGWEYRQRHKDEGRVDETICRVLMNDLREIDNKSTLAATAIALGLCGYRPAGDPVFRLIEENKTFPNMRGHLCVSLALMDDRSAVHSIRKLVEDSIRQPVVVQQAAIALGKLGVVHEIGRASCRERV